MIIVSVKNVVGRLESKIFSAFTISFQPALRIHVHVFMSHQLRDGAMNTRLAINP